jgi:hypothetical protein
MVDKIDRFQPMERTWFYDCQGANFIPTLPLDDLPWFPGFKRSLKGFRVGGFQLIPHRFVDRFLEVARSNGLAPPSRPGTSSLPSGEEGFILSSRGPAVAGYTTPSAEIGSTGRGRSIEGSQEPTAESPVLDERGAGFGDSETSRRVEQAAIAYATAHYRRQGWTVESVEPERIGYDLRCRNAHQERHLEVKGVQGDEVSFIMTAGEKTRAETDTAFFIGVVTRALSSPEYTELSGRELLAEFDFRPLNYKVSRRQQPDREARRG